MGYQASYERIDWDAPRTDAEWKQLADELRGKGAQHRQDAHDSFERCDTDGFMSQWASGVTGSAQELAAGIAEGHGWIEVQALFTLDGQFVTTETRQSNFGRFNFYWLVDRKRAAELGIAKPFINESSAKSPVQRAKYYAQKGYAVGTIKIRPYVTLAGGNVACVRAVALPSKSHLAAGDFTVIRTQHGDLFDSRASSSDKWRWWTSEELAAALAK